MEYLLAALAGWCGTGWPIRFPFGGGGGTPDDPWPDNCPMCGLVIGAIFGAVIYVIIGPEYNAQGSLLATIALGWIGGAFGSSLVRSITRFGRRANVTNVNR